MVCVNMQENRPPWRSELCFTQLQMASTQQIGPFQIADGSGKNNTQTATGRAELSALRGHGYARKTAFSFVWKMLAFWSACWIVSLSRIGNSKSFLEIYGGVLRCSQIQDMAQGHLLTKLINTLQKATKGFWGFYSRKLFWSLLLC